MKLVNFRKDCIGCNSCVENCPSLWSINEKDGKADLKDSEKKGETFVREFDPDLLEQNKKSVKIIKIFK